MAYDILIKGGTVIDGTGNPPRLADIGIDGDRISDVGDLGTSDAIKTIDAYGKYVTPGFIDITNHSDTHLTLFKYPGQESLLMQGVTTIIGGNCGASLAPLGSREAIDAIRKWVDPSEINVNWATEKEYLDVLDSFRFGVNFGTLVGYGTLRRGVIGDGVRELNGNEREALKLLLRQALQEGAFGLSLGLAYGHERIASTEEIIDAGKAVEEAGGMIKIHLRSEGLQVLSSVNEAIRIGRETGAPIQISHFKVIGRKAWPYLSKSLELIASARASGVKIDFDVYPYRTTGSLLYLLIPNWARHGGLTELFKKIDDPEERKKIVEALRSHTLHYDKILVTSAKLKSAVGHTIAELAEEGGLIPEETILEILRTSEGRVTVMGRTVSMENTKREISDPNSIIASDGMGLSQDAQKSDDLTHPRSFGAFPRYLSKFVSSLNIPIAKAIKKITSRPAEKLNIKGRGIIVPKRFADIVVFDPKLLRDRATYQNPYRYPSGIEYVIVNGKVAVEKGRIIDSASGMILRRT
jgi:N-acyl-D-amino-acid deacylase